MKRGRKINIEDWAETEHRDCDYKASNGKTYHFQITRNSYSVAWTCQITGENNPMCHHPERHWSAAGVRKNAIKYLESQLKEQGALNESPRRKQARIHAERERIWKAVNSLPLPAKKKKSIYRDYCINGWMFPAGLFPEYGKARK